MGQVNLIRNGSFEQYTGPGVVPLYWADTVVPSSILFAADGRWAVSITPIVSQPTSQAVPTVPGIEYQLRFALREPVFPSSEFEGYVTAGGPVGPWVVDVSLNNHFSGAFENDHTNFWQYFSFTFTADSSITLVAFSPGAQGSPLLDDVSLTAVPEPSPIVLGGAAVVMAALRAHRARRPRQR